MHGVCRFESMIIPCVCMLTLAPRVLKAPPHSHPWDLEPILLRPGWPSLPVLKDAPFRSSTSTSHSTPTPTLLNSKFDFLFAASMPYCLGLQSAAIAFLSIGFSTQFTLAIILSLTIIILSSSLQKDPIDAPASLPGSSIFHILPFFRRRFDFLNWGFHASGHNIFRFNLLRVS